MLEMGTPFHEVLPFYDVLMAFHLKRRNKFFEAFGVGFWYSSRLKGRRKSFENLGAP